jgi:hypothetical protein
MSAENKVYRRAAIGVLAFALLLSGFFYWKQKNNADFAKDEISFFEQQRKAALESDAREAATCLTYVVSNFPSSLQPAGSALNQRVEGERGRAEQEIIACLRVKTGTDLGEAPDPWIKQYAYPVKFSNPAQ